MDLVKSDWRFYAVAVFLFVAVISWGSAVAQKQDKLVLLMDTDNNGKISRQEYMNFMAAEFDRLDKDKSSDLDAKELAHSQLRVSHRANP